MNKYIVTTLAALALALPLNATAACVTTITASTPTADFIDNGNGTVTHKKTGLTWMRCSLGQNWNGTGCATVTNATYTWQQALQAAAGFNTNGGYAGHGDWRLPNSKELASIVEQQCASPAINAALFPDTPPEWFWSSSPDAGNTNNAWSVHFNYGFVDWYFKSSTFRVRLVRAGQ